MLQFHLPGGQPLIDYADLCKAMEETGLGGWAEILPAQLEQLSKEAPHGDLPRWMEILRALPEIGTQRSDLNRGAILAASDAPLDTDTRSRVEQLLRQLHPWRKGPYRLLGIDIDSEWRSDWKWARLEPAIAPLADRLVLDVGCGNGYHCWRMAGAGARLVVGIDPTQLYLAQFLAVRHFLGSHWPVHLLPLGIEQLPGGLQAFDTVFSMGVLYHRRSPIDHLYTLKGCLRPGGQLVLETLVIEGGVREVLLPRGRYGKMRNVWFIPTPDTLKQWLARCGFSDVRVIDVSRTTTAEQRSTEWMRFESLPQFLHPEDPLQTLEGYPAPIRAILTATAG